MTENYHKNMAAQYWNERLLNSPNNLEAVGYLFKGSLVNEAYTAWEKKVLNHIIAKKEPTDVMDLGCGIGRLSESLLESNYTKNIYLLDLSPQMLKRCEENIKGYNRKKHLVFLNSGCDAVALPDCSLDLIICMGIFEHLPISIQADTIAEINRLLKEGGTLILEINNDESIFLSNIDNPFRKNCQLDNGYFCTIVDHEHIKNTLQKHGLEVREMYYNPIFSLAYHMINHTINNTQNTTFLSVLMENACRIDLGDKEFLNKKFSNQFILEITKSKL